MYRIQLQHKDFMVINKGPGLGMHDEGGEPGLVNRLRTETGLTLYPVHRLDKMTSGLLLLARTQENPAISWFDSSPVREGLRLYRIKPQTGKTHQIRVALKSIGAPILGDDRYGGTIADRGYLHAWRLQFTLAGEAFDLVCPPDEGELFLLPELHTAIAGLSE